MSRNVLHDDDTTKLLHQNARGLNNMEILRPEQKRDPVHHCRTTVICGYCRLTMFWPERSITAKCPYCGNVNYLSATRYWSCALLWLVAAALVLVFAIGMVAGTAKWSSRHQGIVVAWIGLFAAGLVLLIRSCVYYFRPFCMTKGSLVTEV